MAENKTSEPKGPITNVTETSEALEIDTERPRANLANAVWSIIWSVALPSVPILAVTVVLLRVIVKHRVIPNEDQGWPQLHLVTASSNSGHQNRFLDFIDQVRYNGAGPAYYVIYNPSTITTIASWTSRLIPYLSSSIMALVAFFVASHVVQKSRGGHVDQLPDPQQMTIFDQPPRRKWSKTIARCSSTQLETEETSRCSATSSFHGSVLHYDCRVSCYDEKSWIMPSS